jgi:hypothetical protein
MENEDKEKEFIASRINDIERKKGHAFAKLFPHLVERQKARELLSLQKDCDTLEKHLPEIEGLIKSIFPYIGSITEQTKIAASYLLLGKAFCFLTTSLKLAKDGNNLEMMELSRSAKEALGLVILFLEDENKELLNKWFNGKIISNSVAREFQHKMLNERLSKISTDDMPVNEMLKEDYRVMSHYTHSSYAGLLDAVDIFSLNFDFDKNAGYHYSKNNFHILQDLFLKLLMQLRNIFMHLKNKELYAQASDLCKLFTPSVSNEEMLKIVEKYKPQKKD